MHRYYHCNYCSKVRIKAEDIHEKIVAILSEISIKKNSKVLYDSIINTLVKTDVAKRNPTEKIEEKIKRLEKRIRNTEDDLADREIDVVIFNNTINRYKNDISSLKAQLSDGKNEMSEYTKYLKKGIDLISNITTFYFTADVQAERKLLSSICNGNLIFSKEDCRTPSLNKSLLMIMSVDKGFSKQKIGGLLKYLTYTGNVEKEGKLSNLLLGDLKLLRNTITLLGNTNFQMEW